MGGQHILHEGSDRDQAGQIKVHVVNVIVARLCPDLLDGLHGSLKAATSLDQGGTMPAMGDESNDGKDAPLELMNQYIEY